MTESEFLELAEASLDQVEAAFDHLADGEQLDVECKRSGNVLEIEFVDNGLKIIVNSQAPMQEIWVASKSGGFHYRRDGSQWFDTRTGEELFTALSRVASEYAGRQISLPPMH